MPVTPETILALGRKFMESRIFLSAAELDLFTILSENEMSAEEVADKLKTTLRGITILLDAVVSMGLLEKKNNKYHCPESIASILSKKTSTSIMPMVMHSSALWRRWSDLTAIVQNGKDKTENKILKNIESEQEAFIGAMHVVASKIAPGIVKAIDPGKAVKLLDIGGASGTYTEAFLESSPGMTATLFDLPPVIQIAKRRLEGTGLPGRITFIEGDYNKDELTDGHDLALLSAIIHQNSPQQNSELYRKIYHALAPGGRIVIRDHIMSPDHTQPAAGALFAVNMLVGTSGGGTYTFDEIMESLESAGFVKIRLIQSDEMMNGLVEGFKP